MNKKIALVLSGGGAKGAFQVGAERYAREVKGYHWDVIAGVSIGALNGAFIAMKNYAALQRLWALLSPETVFGRSRGRTVRIAKRVILGKPSFFDNELFKGIIDREVDPSAMTIDLRIGVVSLITGEYRVFRSTDPNFKEALLASAALPPVFPPVDAGAAARLVDGGVRKVSPITDVLDAQPDEIVIINCNPLHPPAMDRPPRSAFGINQRAFDISMHRVFLHDMSKFLLINCLVEQAEAASVTLRKPDGRPYRRYPCVIIQPDERTGDTVDLSPAHIRRAMDAGWEKAKAVLG